MLERDWERMGLKRLAEQITAGAEGHVKTRSRDVVCHMGNGDSGKAWSG